MFLIVLGVILLVVFSVCLINYVRMYEKAVALESMALAVIRFGGAYGVMLSKVQSEGGVYREGISSNDEVICQQLEEVGLLTEFPGSWVLSGAGEVALKTISHSEIIKTE